MATTKKAAPKKDERADLTDIKDELAGEETRSTEDDATLKAEKTAPKKGKMTNSADIDGESANEEPRRAEEVEDPNETWKKTMKKIRKMKDRVYTSMVDGSKKAEKWHKKAASWPLQKMSKIDRLKQISVDVDEVQTKTITHGYDLLRTAVDSVDDIYEEILNRAEKRTMAA